MHSTASSLWFLGIVHVIFAVHDSDFELISYDTNLRTNLSVLQRITDDHFKGYHYRVYTKRLTPYFYFDDDYKLTGLDYQLLQIISKSQNATIDFFMYEENYPIWIRSQNDPQLKYTYDMALRIAHHPEKDSLDKVYLPEWDEICVAVPKRHQRLMILQLTRPFQLEVWIFCLAFVAIRTLYTRRSLRLLSLTFILLEFLLTEGYLAKVIQFLTDMKYVPDPKTITELIALDETFAVNSNERTLLRNFANVKTLDRGQSQRYVRIHPTVHFCQTAYTVEHSESNFNPETNDKFVFILEERLSALHNFYGFARNHPLEGIFRRKLRYVFESGVWGKIYDRYQVKEGQFRKLLAPNRYPIDFRDLYSLWVVIVKGWLVCLVCFAGEVYLGYRLKGRS